MIDKVIECNTLSEAVKDLPRSQANRKGKSSPISPTVKAIVFRKAKDTNRSRRKRRAHHLSTEIHAGRKLSETSIKGILKAHGLAFRRSRSTIAMKTHHVMFRKRHAEVWGQKSLDFWKKFIFSDEKTFRMSNRRHRQNDGLWVSVDDDMDELTHVVDRHSGSVSVWGGVSWYGKLPLDIVVGTQDEKHYVAKVVKDKVKPFMANHPEVEMFQQDGAAIHSSKAAVKALDSTIGSGRWTRPPPPPCKKTDRKGNVVRVQKTSKKGTTRNYKVDSDKCKCHVPSEYVHPAKSPDLNIVEHVWTWMTNWLNERPPAGSEVAFKALLQQAWPMEYVEDLFKSIPRRFSAVLEADGHMTKY